MSERRLTIMVHGETGAGKSWLGNTAPGPRLVLDAEGRADYLHDTLADPSGKTNQKVIYWDPHEPPPEGSSDPSVVTVVDVQEFNDVALPYKWLASGQHPFNSVIIDSLTEVQQRLIDKVAGTSQLQHNAWGEVLRELDGYIRKFRDLRKNKIRPLWAVVVIAGSQEKDGKQRPLVQGQIATRAPFHFDVVGYMGKRFTPEGSKERYLVIDGFDTALVAKDNTHDLNAHYGDTIINPSLSAMLTVLNATPTEQAEAAPANNTGENIQ